MKVHEALKRASSFFIEPAAAEILLIHHLGVTRTKFFQMMTEEVPEEGLESFEKDLDKLAKGVPVQHITGEEVFYGRRFRVNRDVLIPRPETEELVAFVLNQIEKRFPERNKLEVVDVGTGSGAIATTLALENQRVSVSAVDLSKAALKVAEENAKQLAAKVSFIEGDLLEPLLSTDRKVDVIVSNPPYIPERDEEKLDVNVRDHEPHLALFGGKDGFTVYRKLIEQIPAALNVPGLIALEVGIQQSEQVADMLREKLPGAEMMIQKDINGKERMVAAFVANH